MLQKYDYTTHGDIGIDDVSEDAIGNALEDVGTKDCADDDSTKSETVVCQDGRGKEAVVGPNKGHHHIANHEIGLRHRHIMFFRRLTLDEIEHSWRALHAKETSHQSAQCTSTYLYSFSRRQLDLLAKQGEIDTDDYQCHTEDPFQYVVFNAGQSKDGYGRYNNKRQQYRPKSFPNDIASHSPHDDSRGGNGQKSRESCGLAVCRQEERQHCHNEDAKAEARGALHKTGPDAQQEYGYHNTTHRLSILPMLSGDR